MARSRWVRSLVVVAAVAVAGGVFGIVPVRSQVPRLEARLTDAIVPMDDPWADVWGGARRQEVPLSAQNVSPPFGGGSVDAIVARALYDGTRVYVLVEWFDPDLDDAVNSATAFSDAVALQFPSASAADVPPYTMGAEGQPVNIWHWKAVWQADADLGFAGGDDRYPDTAVDDYIEGLDEPEFAPARELGNLLAQTEHASPVENTVAAGFGSLTSAEVQDVDGYGEWRDGRWRALFARDLAAADPSFADFAAGGDTMVAFAVWDGGDGDRNGQKSIAQFIELSLSEEVAVPVAVGELPLAGDDGSASPWPFVGALLVALAAIVATAEMAMRKR